MNELEAGSPIPERRISSALVKAFAITFMTLATSCGGDNPQPQDPSTTTTSPTVDAAAPKNWLAVVRN